MKRLQFTLAVLLIAAPLAASPNLPDGKWWKRPRIAAHIGLTPEQTREIDGIFVKSRGRLIDLKADLEKRQAELQDLMEDESSDRKAVALKIDDVENARAELQKARALMFLDMKGVLRPEQWERVKEMQARMRQVQEDRRRRMRLEEQRFERRGGRAPSPRAEGERPTPRD